MKTVVIDVREKDEFESGHVEGALNITSAELLAGAQKLSGIPKDTHLVVYCRSGARSAAAIKILKDLGFTNLSNGINQDTTEKYLHTA